MKFLVAKAAILVVMKVALARNERKTVDYLLGHDRSNIRYGIHSHTAPYAAHSL